MVEESREVPGISFRKVIKEMKSSLNKLSEIILKWELFLLDFAFPSFVNFMCFYAVFRLFSLKFFTLQFSSLICSFSLK